jgi:hypothetical protein
MSATIIRYLHCDGCRDPYDNAPMPSFPNQNITGETVSEQRRHASQDGWAVNVNGKDYCPECRGTL